MAVSYLVVAILAAAVAVFAIQNGSPTRVRFLAWGVEEVPVSALILAALAIGFVVAGVPLWLQRWRLRTRVRTLEARVRMLETAVEEHQRATVARRPGAPGER